MIISAAKLSRFERGKAKLNHDEFLRGLSLYAISIDSTETMDPSETTEESTTNGKPS